MSLTKEQIRGAKDRPRQFVPIREWTPEGEAHDPSKHGVWVGTMSGRDRDRWEQTVYAKKANDEKANLENVRALLAISTVQDEAGQPLFDANDTWLSEKAGSALTAIFEVALKLNRLSKADQDELVKN